MVDYSKSNTLLSDELTGRQYRLARYGGQAFYEDLMVHYRQTGAPTDAGVHH